MVDTLGMIFVAILITAIIYVAATWPSIYKDDGDGGDS